MKTDRLSILQWEVIQPADLNGGSLIKEVYSNKYFGYNKASGSSIVQAVNGSSASVDIVWDIWTAKSNVQDHYE
jgi:hypothetical protein